MNNVIAKRVQSARTKLLLDQPFFGVLALQLKIFEDPSASTVYTDGHSMGYNPEFFAKLTQEQLVAVIAHEVMHCACGHPWRRDARHMLKWNFACDYAINDILTKAGFKLPAGCLIDKQYEGKHSEWIYDRLPDIKTITIYGGGCGVGEVRDSPNTTGEAVDKDGNPIRTEADWQQAVQQSLNAAKMQGKLPANIERELGQLCEPTVDWRSLLRRYVQEIVKADYTWTMPNRRYLASGFYLPALHSLACGRIAVAIDTSGSIDQVLLSQFAAELQAIASEMQPSQVDVMYCDTEVHRHDTFMHGEQIEINAVGGGGTSFVPVFEKVKKDVDPPKVLIYLTDLQGEFPKEAPEYPVIWAACANGTVPFGDLVLCTR